MLSQSIAIVLFLFFFITLPSTFSIPHSICALSLSFCPSLARLHTRFIYLCKNRPIKKLINVHHIAFIAESVIGLVFQGMEHKIYTQTSTHTHTPNVIFERLKEGKPKSICNSAWNGTRVYFQSINTDTFTDGYFAFKRSTQPKWKHMQYILIQTPCVNID